MNYLIIEDEFHAARRLKQLINKVEPESECIAIIDSVEDAVDWFQRNEAPDLAFFDIQLADGLSFSIFQKTDVSIPVIFTTAFDEYALKAFKANSVDYLLKPIDENELTGALTKYRRLFGAASTSLDDEVITRLMRRLNTPDYVKRFLIKQGTSLSYVNVDNIARFFSENSMTFIVTNDGFKHNIEHTLDQVEELLDPEEFFRINRKIIVQVDSITRMSTYFNSRLKLALKPRYHEDAIVSRDRVKDFKAWIVGRV